MASTGKAANKNLSARVAANLARRIAAADTLSLGLSGGRDSVALFDLLLELRASLTFTLRCIHVHHGLSVHAADWAGFCGRLCAEHGVPLVVERVVVDRDDARGIEAAARAARHAVFTRQPGWLVTAHHRDDQAETLLLQLLRGAGPKGLAAMAQTQGRSLRPLLDASRDDIDAYVRARGLRWVDDDSNSDNRHRRNAWREMVLPALRALFPQAGATLARAARLQGEAAGLLDELAELDAAGAVAGDRLDCAALAALAPARARNLLRWFVARRGGRMPQQVQLDQALTQLLGARDDARVRAALGDGSLARWRGGAYWLPELPEWDGEIALDAAPTGLPLGASGVALTLSTSVGEGMSQARLAGAVVRLRRGGESLRRRPGGPLRSLSAPSGSGT